MELFGFKVNVVFLTKKDNIFAYAWHYSKEKAIKHLNKIAEYHGLKGKVKESKEMEKWLKNKIEEVVINGKKFEMPAFEYKNKNVYKAIINIPKGKTSTYSEISKTSGVKYQEVLISLMRNPFQILIPCHRLLTKKGTLMGFYPLGREVKRKILEIEGER